MTVVTDPTWPGVTLSKMLVSLEAGARPRGGATSEGVISIGGEHLDGAGGFRLDRLRYIPAGFAERLAKGRIRTGDILVVKDGATTGKVSLVRSSFPFTEAFANEHVFVCRPDESVDSVFLYHFLASGDGQRQILSDFRGAAQGGISRGFADKVQVPLPSLDRQRLLAGAIEEQATRIDAAQAGLFQVLRSIDTLRRSVALAATSGLLVPLQLGPGADDSPEGFLGRHKEARTKPGAQHEVKSWDVPARPLPPNWAWARLIDLGELDRGRSRHRPRNDPRLYEGQYPFVQTGDIRRSGGRIRRHSQTYNEVGLAQSKLWPAGTLCITIAANIAETAILTYPACFPDSVVGFVHDGDPVTTRYVQLCLQTMKQRLWELAPATAQKNINLSTLEAVAIPLPPPSEQVRIVSEVDRILEAADVVEAEADTALKRSRGLRASVVRRSMTPRVEDYPA